MEYNEDRNSLRHIPTFTLLPPPRFDAAASAAARPVEPLGKWTILGLHLKPKFSRLINRRLKFLALMAIVGLATGAAGGMLVVERDKQQHFDSSAPMIQVSGEQTSTFDSAAPTLENADSSLEVAEPVENTVRSRRNQRRPRKQPTSELVVVSNADEDEDEDEDSDRDKDNDEDKDEDRQKERERNRNRKDREDDGDSSRSNRVRQRAVMYDVMRVRKP